MLTVSVEIRQFVCFYFSAKFNIEHFAKLQFQLDLLLWQTLDRIGAYS